MTRLQPYRVTAAVALLAFPHTLLSYAVPLTPRNAALFAASRPESPSAAHATSIQIGQQLSQLGNPLDPPSGATTPPRREK